MISYFIYSGLCISTDSIHALVLINYIWYMIAALFDAHLSPFWCCIKMSLDYFADLLLSRGYWRVVTAAKTQTTDVRCYTQSSPGWQHLDFICKNVINLNRNYTLSLPSIVLSICQLNKEILFVVGHRLILLCRRHYTEVSGMESLEDCLLSKKHAGQALVS